MATDTHEWTQALRDPIPTRRREALTRLEHAPDAEVQAFAQQARDLEISIALELCPVFAGATRKALVDLLGLWATAADPSLRERALQALTAVPASARQRCLQNLLEAQTPETRAAACRLLGDAGGQASRSLLLRRLKDEDTDVVLAALDALERLQITDAPEALRTCLQHAAAPVRARALRAAVTLAPGAAFPAEAVLQRLQTDPVADVRLAACWALERRPDPRSRQALLALLQEETDVSLRVAATNALVAHPGETVVERLMYASVNDATPAFALACGRAVRRMPEHLVIGVSRRLLEHEEVAVRMEAAAMLAGLGYDSVGRLLTERLAQETDNLVLAALIEALGHMGRLEAWDAIYARIEGDPLVAYPAVEALAELMDHDHVHPFASVLSIRSEATLQEAVLKRLGIYGRANGLQEELFDLLAPFFLSNDPKLAMLALQAASHTRDRASIPVVLNAIGSIDDPAVLDAAAAAAFHLASNSCLALYEAGGHARLDALTAVLHRLEDVDDSAPGLLQRLAARTVEGAPGARACLDAALRLTPESFTPVLEHAAPDTVETLLAAWSDLPATLQRRSPLDLAVLLRSERAAVRLRVLQMIAPPAADNLLSAVADLALTDPDPYVREYAIERIGPLLNA